MPRKELCVSDTVRIQVYMKRAGSSSYPSDRSASDFAGFVFCVVQFEKSCQFSIPIIVQNLYQTQEKVNDSWLFTLTA